MSPPKLLIAAGAILMGIGMVWLAVTRLGWPVGRLPGDLTYRGERTTIFFPLATCVVVSIVLTALSWMLSRWRGQ